MRQLTQLNMELPEVFGTVRQQFTIYWEELTFKDVQLPDVFMTHTQVGAYILANREVELSRYNLTDGFT